MASLKWIKVYSLPGTKVDNNTNSTAELETNATTTTTTSEESSKNPSSSSSSSSSKQDEKI
ncbi:MAG: hypothetical protein Q8T09_13665 [Candidatus Melainabacteria bacterium]|nr:hypothetical protein [Candidatus Melainabacteria bacterium]